MAVEAVRCPHCQSEEVGKIGDDQQREGPVAVSAERPVWPDLPSGHYVSGAVARGEAAEAHGCSGLNVLPSACGLIRTQPAS